MKRFAVLIAIACAAALFVAPPAFAAKKAAPTPSPSPAAQPTPTAEPLDKAIPRLQGVLKSDPNNTEAMGELAGDYLQVNRPDLAYQLTQQLLKNGTKTAPVYYIDGLALTQLGQPQGAVADLEQASNLDPTNGLILSTLTNAYLQVGRYDDAERVSKRATTFNKSDPRAFMSYGAALAAKKNYDDARAQFEIAAKLLPTDATPLLMEARTYIEQNSAPLALQVLDRAIAVDPGNGDVYITKAQLLAAQHDVKGAVGVYETMLGKTNDATLKVQIMDAEAHVYAQEKQNSQADAIYKKAIAQFPNVPEAHVAYGDFLAYINQKQQAESEWTTALGPNNDNPEALARLGELYAQNNDFPKAIGEFQRLVALNQNDPQAQMSLGQVYLAAKQPDKAHDTFRKAYDMTHAPQALAAVGQADFNMHNYKEASEIFDAIQKGAPAFMDANPPLYVVAGRCYSANNESDKAKAAYTKFLTYVKPDSQEAKEVNKLLADLGKKH